MKKILLILFLLVTGCSSYEFKLKDEITEVKYGEIEIIEEDYEKTKNLINKNDFNEENPSEKFNDTLTVKTKSDLYTFKLSDNYIEYNNHFSKNNALINYLEKIEEDYYDIDFFNIEYTDNYKINETDTNILLDNTNSYIILKTDKDLKDFKINLEEFNGHDYDDIDLLYDNEKIKANNIVIRKNLEKSAIKISFKNPYNYDMSVIVKNENGKINFETLYKEKDLN